LILSVATTIFEQNFFTKNIINNQMWNHMKVNDCLVTYIERDIFYHIENAKINHGSSLFVSSIYIIIRWSILIEVLNHGYSCATTKKILFQDSFHYQPIFQSEFSFPRLLIHRTFYFAFWSVEGLPEWTVKLLCHQAPFQSFCALESLTETRKGPMLNVYP
jgi:hypothetical protein